MTHAGKTRVLVAFAAVACALAWMGFLVQFHYSGQIAGLFYTGGKSPLPPELEAHTSRVGFDDIGYDAQFYHVIAHDPLLRRGYIAYVDDPRLRWRRIGVPGLAALLAFGSDRCVDAVYLAIQLACAFLGTFWLSGLASAAGRHPAWGLAFLAVPATAVSIDRMNIDLPLAAIAVGLVWLANRRVVYVLLCAAPLVRETGLVLVAAWSLSRAVQKQWRAAARGALCVLPFFTWWIYVDLHTPVDAVATWTARYPFGGVIEQAGITLRDAIAHPDKAATLEVVAIMGILMAIAQAAVLARERRTGFVALSAILFAVFAAAIGNREIWASAYATGRTMSPLMTMLGLVALRERRWIFAAPVALVLPRIALQYAAEIKVGLITAAKIQ